MMGGWYVMSIDTGLDVGRGTSERARGRGVGEGDAKSWRFAMEVVGVIEVAFMDSFFSCCAVTGDEGAELVGDRVVP